MELDKWENKVNAAGNMVTWHPVNLSPEIVKAIKDGASFDEAREMVRGAKKEASHDAILELAAAINNAVK